MPLTDTALKALKPRDKSYKKADGLGLFVQINPNGSKLWRMKYRFGGKEKLLALGGYPDVSLKKARERRDAARRLLADHVDPSAHRKAKRASKGERSLANSFEVIAREWFDRFSPPWSKGHFDRVKRQLEKDLYPWIGTLPVDEIDAPTLLSCLRRIEKRGAIVSSHRTRGVAGQVFRYAISTGRAVRDPSRDLRGALAPANSTNFAAITEPKEVGKLMRAIASFEGFFPIKCALSLAPLVFARPGELRMAVWKDIDLEEAEWCYFVTKVKKKHIVPLSRQAVAILKELYPLTGNYPYVFPSIRTWKRPMSENTLNVSLRALGIGKDEMTAHGFRAMARTILSEELNVRPDIIEHQLSHTVKDPNGRAYNRTKFLPQRKEMMQAWADYLDGLRVDCL